MRGFVRTAAVIGTAGAMFIGGSGAAWAHECFVANRSAQGAAGAANSGNWVEVPRAELLAELPGILGEFGATESQIACGMDFAEGALPEVIAIGVGPAKGQGFVVAANMNEKNAGNGRGIDHLDALLGQIFVTCGIAPPA